MYLSRAISLAYRASAVYHRGSQFVCVLFWPDRHRASALDARGRPPPLLTTPREDRSDHLVVPRMRRLITDRIPFNVLAMQTVRERGVSFRTRVKVSNI